MAGKRICGPRFGKSWIAVNMIDGSINEAISFREMQGVICSLRGFMLLLEKRLDGDDGGCLSYRPCYCNVQDLITTR